MFRQPIEAALPIGTPPGDPIFGLLQSRRLDAIGAHAPCLFGPDEAACLQHLEVLNNRRQRDGQRLRELADRCWSEAETLHHHPPGRDRQGLEEEIKWSLLVKHGLKYLIHPLDTARPKTPARGAAGGTALSPPVVYFYV